MRFRPAGKFELSLSPNSIDDLGAEKTFQEIAKKIEAEMQYPGQIKVNVIREVRATEYAK